MVDYDKLIKQLNTLDTEQSHPDTIDLDLLTPVEIARKINREDAKVAAVVEQALTPIARAAEMFAETLRGGGRVLYIGAGTSGRLGVLDAAECPPTFGTEPAQIIGLVSGGYGTMVLSAEGVEDDAEAAVTDLRKHDLSEGDFVVGLAASTRTPYTLAGLEYAHAVGCKTAFIVCNVYESMKYRPDILIELPVGPEVITGSTRMKSGTAQKMALNMISTTAMVLLGKTCGNLMIDLQAKSEKLKARSRKMLMDLLRLTLEQADGLLKQADGSVKLAIVMHQFTCDESTALEKLQKAGGFVRRVE